ncbi:type IX secretion system sortase PorU [Flavobacterium sp. H122]|uniref:type IX secretion system sortase PorU n=1 Tax=Flavobacterium sp. H122 TaxID=2529860 RepID=UPI0010AB346B|nr:type IX secretion system sortase PorU [Flavobacterium sp. H122]
MKHFLLLIVFLFPKLILAQDRSGEIVLKWNKTAFRFNEKVVIDIPNFQSENLVFNADKNTLLFSKKIEGKITADETSLAITNVRYELIPENELGKLNRSAFELLPQFKISNISARNENSVLLTFNPIIKEGGSFKKIVSFNYSYNSKNINVFRTSQNRIGLQSSVLKDGEWRRFYVEKSGVYKISKSFLSQLGVNVNADPRNLKIYGNGGAMIPLVNSENTVFDLQENAVQFVGENDGVFNDSDYILMYCEGMDNWSNDNQCHTNLYADRSYYYVTTNSSAGKRMADYVEPSGTPDVVYNKYDDYVFYEKDEINIGAIGRKWFGERLSSQSSFKFDFAIPDRDPLSPFLLKIRMAATSSSSTSVKVSVNGTQAGDAFFSGIFDLGSIKAVESNFVYTGSAASSNISVDLAYNNNGNPASASYLDFITIQSKVFLKGKGKQFRFKIDEVKNNTGICQYDFTDMAVVKQIWDISDKYSVSVIRKSTESNFSFKSDMGTEKYFLVVEESDFYSPKADNTSRVVNQDLKGTVFLDSQNNIRPLDYLIVCPDFLMSQAERLADFHRNYSGLSVKVVGLDEIYHEFSSGKQDIGAIRNFVKYIYDNPQQGQNIKYLCLFGDASFDFKNRISKNTNIVPVFQSLDSYTLFSSFVSDDYFGLMDDSEGNMIGAQGLDIAVGRILVTNIQEAEQMVTKIIDYHDQKAFGKWRNNLVFLADDVDKQSDASLQSNLDAMSENITANRPFFNSKKIFMDAYVQETSSGGQRYPVAKNEFLNSFNQGALVIDYLGHGGEDGFSGERIFDIADVKSLNHQYKYPLFITVTCEFTRFDNPLRETGGEEAFKMEFGGPISLITTTRQVGQTTGENFNTNLAPILFAYNSNEKVSIAEVLRKTKTATMSTGNYVISYIGDPALKLAIPEPEIKITKINDISMSAFTGSLEALAKIKISGEIVDGSNNVLSDYNGELFVNIYDKFIDKTTLANDGITVGGVPYKITFKALGETIFKGNASVKNGLFEFFFVVPKDIKVPVGNGKISLYSKKENALVDNQGYELNVKVGGVNVNAVADNVPPTVRLFMNDESFVNGGITNQSPVLLAFLEDENGINTAGGIGHDIQVYLDGKETELILLNDYYDTEKDDYTKGVVRYQLKGLTPGLHVLTLKVWDVYNNLVTSELQFVVADDSQIKLTNVLNYPNPFVSHTEFWFTHNKPFEPLEVQVQIMTITGKIVWTKNQTVTTVGFTSRDITWDGRDDFGDKIGKGVYIYKLTVKSTFSNKKTEKFEKLVIL